MLIKVKDLGGRATEVDADASWRIKDLSRRAAELLRLPPQTRCCLYAKGSRLADASLLESADLSSDEVLVLITLRKRGKKDEGEGSAACGGAPGVTTPPTPAFPARSFNPPLRPDTAPLDERFSTQPSAGLRPPASISAFSPGQPYGSLDSARSGPTSSTLCSPPSSSACTSDSLLVAQPLEARQDQTRESIRPGTGKDGACETAIQDSPEGCRCDGSARETAAQSSDPQSFVEGRQDQGQCRWHPQGSQHATSPHATTPGRKQTGPTLLESQDSSSADCSARPRSNPAKRKGSPGEGSSEKGIQSEDQDKGDVHTWPQLPAALAELEAKFSRVNTVWGFMSGQMVETTWERMLQGLEGMAASSGEPVMLQDIKAMATMAPHVVKLVELPDGPGSTSEAQVGLSDGVQDSQEGGAKGASESAPGTGTAAEASVGGLSRTPESSDCLREDWGPAAVGPQAVRRESAGGAPCENGAERAGREKSAPDACTGAAEQDASPLAPGNIIVKLVDKVLPGPASAPRVDQKSAAGERAWVPVDDGPQIMRLSVTAIRNRVEKRRAAFAAALEAAAQRVRSDWLTQLGGSSSQKAPSNSREADHQGHLAAFNDLPLSIFLAEAQLSTVWAHEGDQQQAQPSSAAREGAVEGSRQRKGKGPNKKHARAAPAIDRGPLPKRTRKQRSDKGEGVEGGGGAAEEERWEEEEEEEGGDGVGGEGGGSVLDPVAPRLSREERKQLRWRRACSSTKELSSEEMLAHLREGLGGSGQIVHCERLSQRKARYKKVPLPLSDSTLSVLKGMGISRLYHHQAVAIEAAMRGRNVVVSTPTASGKSLCYNIPVLEAYERSSEACALYLFPTKALTQDQQRALEQLTAPFPSPPNMAIYDGDTPFNKRAGVRSSCSIMLTNPDMLHMTILPQYKDFARLLSNLKYVVFDEAHSYSGAFGCHTALILRRLRRICARVYGSFPTFIVCTATCANPEEHAQTLVGVDDWCAVGAQDDGSPCGDKTFVLWNPPVIGTPAVVVANRSRRRQTPAARDPSPVLEQRRCSPIVEVALLLAEMVQHNLRCLAFCKTRKLSELVLSYTKDMLRERCPELVNSVVAYRAGYSAEDRRRIERELFGGRLRAVAATNALELGVDIGSLDATVHLGFQGTVASLWQQAGRAGRREKASLSIYVAFGCPLDQYFMVAPERLFSRPIEAARLDCQNPEVLKQQVMCAAAELPLLVHTDAPFFFSHRSPRRRPVHLLASGEGGAGCTVGGHGALKPKLEVPSEDGVEDRVQAELTIVSREREVGPESGVAGSGKEAGPRECGAAPAGAPGGGSLVPSRGARQGVGEGMMETGKEQQERLGNGSCSVQSSIGRLDTLVKHLNATGMLGRSPTDCHVDLSWRYIGPAPRIWNEVKIRAIDEHCFAVIDERTGAVMEEIEEKKAFFTIFEGAVYMQQGKTYIVTELDLKRREAKCRRASVRYWTSVLDMTEVQLTGGTLAYETVGSGSPQGTAYAGGAPAQAPGTSGRGFLENPREKKEEDLYWDSGPTRGTPLVEYSPSGIVTSAQWSTCVVSTSYPSYRKVWRGANIPFDQVDLFLPRITFPTQACWIRVPSSAREAVAGLSKDGDPPVDYGSSLHGACHAVVNMLPAYLACNPADVGSECKHPNDTRFFPDRVLLFDRHTGGIGLAPQICNVFGDLLLAAFQVVSRCDCTDESGCPGCIQTAGCASYNKVLCKAGAKVILGELVKTECNRTEEHRDM